MKRHYLLRLDDACPTMKREAWDRIESILDRYGVKPMVGIIPANADPMQMIDPEDESFWDKALAWDEKGWAIALHGADHCYISEVAGINPLWNRSEFAGVPLDVQKNKIRTSLAIMRENGLEPKYFFAPSHTFDENTLVALKEESAIRVISDTIAFGPYRKGDFVFIPQMGGHCTEMKLPGTWTFCLHPSMMDEPAFRSLEAFLSAHSSEFISFSDIDLTSIGPATLADRVLSFLYFTRRRLKGTR